MVCFGQARQLAIDGGVVLAQIRSGAGDVSLGAQRGIQLVVAAAAEAGDSAVSVKFLLPRMTRQIAPFISILSFIKVDGKKVYEPAKVFKEGVNWPIVLTIGALSAIGGLVVSDEADVKVWLSGCLSSQFTNFGFAGYLIFAIVAAVYPSCYPPIHTLRSGTLSRAAP